MKNNYYIDNGIAYISLTQNQITTVDEGDLPLISPYRWYADRNKTNGNRFYVLTKVRGENGKERRLYMHILINDTPPGLKTDHIDNDGLNNRRSNLRTATQVENLRNRGKNRNNTSGYKGVYWHKAAKKWRARIETDGRTISLGLYDTPLEASYAYEYASMRLFGAFNGSPRSDGNPYCD